MAKKEPTKKAAAKKAAAKKATEPEAPAEPQVDPELGYEVDGKGRRIT